MIVVSNTLKVVYDSGDGPGATTVRFVSEVCGSVVVDLEKSDLIEGVTERTMTEGGDLDEDICGEVVVMEWSLDKMEVVETDKHGQCLRLTLSIKEFKDK